MLTPRRAVAQVRPLKQTPPKVELTTHEQLLLIVGARNHRDAFFYFLKRRHCEEILLCWEDTTQLLQSVRRDTLNDTTTRNERVVHILETYLEAEAPMEVNLPDSQLRQQLLRMGMDIMQCKHDQLECPELNMRLFYHLRAQILPLLIPEVGAFMQEYDVPLSLQDDTPTAPGDSDEVFHQGSILVRLKSLNTVASVLRRGRKKVPKRMRSCWAIIKSGIGDTVYFTILPASQAEQTQQPPQATPVSQSPQLQQQPLQPQPLQQKQQPWLTVNLKNVHVTMEEGCHGVVLVGEGIPVDNALVCWGKPWVDAVNAVAHLTETRRQHFCRLRRAVLCQATHGPTVYDSVTSIYSSMSSTSPYYTSWSIQPKSLSGHNLSTMSSGDMARLSAFVSPRSPDGRPRRSGSNSLLSKSIRDSWEPLSARGERSTTVHFDSATSPRPIPTRDSVGSERGRSSTLDSSRSPRSTTFSSEDDDSSLLTRVRVLRSKPPGFDTGDHDLDDNVPEEEEVMAAAVAAAAAAQMASKVTVSSKSASPKFSLRGIRLRMSRTSRSGTSPTESKESHEEPVEVDPPQWTANPLLSFKGNRTLAQRLPTQRLQESLEMTSADLQSLLRKEGPLGFAKRPLSLAAAFVSESSEDLKLRRTSSNCSLKLEAARQQLLDTSTSSQDLVASAMAKRSPSSQALAQQLGSEATQESSASTLSSDEGDSDGGSSSRKQTGDHDDPSTSKGGDSKGGDSLMSRDTESSQSPPPRTLTSTTSSPSVISMSVGGNGRKGSKPWPLFPSSDSSPPASSPRHRSRARSWRRRTPRGKQQDAPPKEGTQRVVGEAQVLTTFGGVSLPPKPAPTKSNESSTSPVPSLRSVAVDDVARLAPKLSFDANCRLVFDQSPFIVHPMGCRKASTPASPVSPYDGDATYNGRFQRLLDALACYDGTEDSLDMDALTTECDPMAAYVQLWDDFLDEAQAYARILVSELHLPDAHKSYTPVARSDYMVRYRVHDMVYDVARVDQGNSDHSDSDSDSSSSSRRASYRAVAKVLGHERKGRAAFMMMMMEHGHGAMRVPMLMVLDYLGYRILVQAASPVALAVTLRSSAKELETGPPLLQPGEDSLATLMYGLEPVVAPGKQRAHASTDVPPVWRFAQSNAAVMDPFQARVTRWLNRLSTRLGLRPHPVTLSGDPDDGDGDGEDRLVATSRHLRVWEGSDHRLYVTGLRFLMPPFLDSPGGWNAGDAVPVGSQRFRPEFLASWNQSRLCSDADYVGSRGRGHAQAPQILEDVREAMSDVYTVRVQSVAFDMSEALARDVALAGHVDDFEPSAFLHEAGLCTRHMGLVLRCLGSHRYGWLLLAHMCARIVKDCLRAVWRECGVGAEAHAVAMSKYKRAAAKLLHTIFANTQKSHRWWDTEMRQQLDERFAVRPTNWRAFPASLRESLFRSTDLCGCCVFGASVVWRSVVKQTGIRARPGLQGRLLRDDSVWTSTALFGSVADIADVGICIKECETVPAVRGWRYMMRAKATPISPQHGCEDALDLYRRAMRCFMRAMSFTCFKASLARSVAFCCLKMVQTLMTQKGIQSHRDRTSRDFLLKVVSDEDIALLLHHAEQLCISAIQKDWKDPMMHILFARVLVQSGRLDEAESHLLIPLQKNPNNVPYLRLYAAFLRDYRQDEAWAPRFDSRADVLSSSE